MSGITIDRDQGLSIYGGDAEQYFREVDRSIEEILAHEQVAKHGHHDQKSHGSWATGGPTGEGTAGDATATLAEYDARTMTDWASWTQTWTGEQKWAADRYQAGGYMPINQTLRGNKLDPSTTSSLQGRPAEQYIKAIDSLLQQAPLLPHEVVVYRRIAYDPDEPGWSDRNFFDAVGKPGTSFGDRGFTSTTADPGHARLMMSSARDVGLAARLMVIHVPAGTKAAYLGMDREGGAFSSESELLLPRGGRFVVRSADATTSVVDYEPPQGYRR